MPLQEIIIDILNGKWDHEITQFSLPPLMTLVCLIYLVILGSYQIFIDDI